MIEDAAAISSSASGAIKSNGTPRQRGGSRSEEARGRMRAMRAQQGGGGAHRALSEFVRDLVSGFLADSFGLISFASVLRVFLRTGFSPTAR